MSPIAQSTWRPSPLNRLSCLLVVKKAKKPRWDLATFDSKRDRKVTKVTKVLMTFVTVLFFITLYNLLCCSSLNPFMTNIMHRVFFSTKWINKEEHSGLLEIN